MNQEKVGIKTPEYVSLQFQLAGLGSRTAAFIIDQILLMTANIVILFTLFLIMAGAENIFVWAISDSFVFGMAIIVLFILNWGYFFAFEYFQGGRTIGKKLLGIRVIQENGHSITLLSSFIRNFLRIIDSLPASYFLGILMIFFHSKHKRIGDLVAGTIVVHERKTKKKKKLTPFEKEIEKRHLTKEDLVIDEWKLKAMGAKEWNLIKTYCSRIMQLPELEKNQLTREIAEILFPKFDIEMSGKNFYDMENALFVIYLHLKDEWEFEL